MKRLTVGILLLMCVFLSGFFFHRGNQNREYDVSGMQPASFLIFWDSGTTPTTGRRSNGY